MTFYIFDLLLLPPPPSSSSSSFLHPPRPSRPPCNPDSPGIRSGDLLHLIIIYRVMRVRALVLSLVCTHTLLKAAWAVKDCDSLQVVLDKECKTEAAVETIFPPPLSLPPLELCGQAGSSRGDGDQFPCRATSSAVFLMPTYCIEEEEEMRASEEKPCWIFVV